MKGILITIAFKCKKENNYHYHDCWMRDNYKKKEVTKKL